MYLPNDTLLQGGKYRIVRYINSGGFGCTYEGEHVMLKTRIAIKEFFVSDFCNRDENTHRVTVGTKTQHALVDKLRSKFIDEARAISTLRHNNIVHVSDVFEENGTAYYVMDYIDGESISGIVKRMGVIPEQKALKYIRQICEALRYVHDNNRLHLDIKPANIMVDKNDNAILIDFGASKQYDEEAGENTSTLMGKTPGYAPIEQMGNDVVRFYPATDIYALGATLYKMITGKTPLKSNVRASGEEELPMPADISPNVRNAIEQAMRIRKVERPQDVDSFLSLLDAKPVSEADEKTEISVKTANEDKTIVNTPSEEPVVAYQPANPPKTTKTTPTTPPTGGQNKKYIAWIAICAIVVVASVVIFVVMGRGNSATEGADSSNMIKEETEQQLPTTVTDLQYQWVSGDPFTYTGEVAYVDNKPVPNGKGEGKYPSGTYKGEYKMGARNGKGSFVFTDGSNNFEGTFANDKYDQGKLVVEDKSYFQGSFKDFNPYDGAWYEANGSKICNVSAGMSK